jgi:hypothetical protein
LALAPGHVACRIQASRQGAFPMRSSMTQSAAIDGLKIADDLPAFGRAFIAALQRAPAGREMAMPLAD